MNKVSIELALDLFTAVEKYKTEAKTLAGIISRIWRMDMLNTEKCEIMPSLELTQYAVKQISYSFIVLLHSDNLPEATRLEDADLDEIINWLHDHWQSGTVAILIP